MVDVQRQVTAKAVQICRLDPIGILDPLNTAAEVSLQAVVLVDQVLDLLDRDLAVHQDLAEGLSSGDGGVTLRDGASGSR